MHVLLPGLTNDEIAVKVAQRRAILDDAVRVEREDKKRDFETFLAAYRLRPRVAALVDAANVAGYRAATIEAIGDNIRREWLYVQSAEVATKIQTTKDTGYAIIPITLQTELHQETTCVCSLHAVYEKANPTYKQTFQVTQCPDHAGLTVAETHDAVHGERARVRRVERILLADEAPELVLALFVVDASGEHVFRPGVTYVYSFSGVGLTRLLTIEAQGGVLTVLQKTNLQTHCDTVFGLAKVLVT
jgi:hypothetical protein